MQNTDDSSEYDTTSEEEITENDMLVTHPYFSSVATNSSNIIKQQIQYSIQSHFIKKKRRITFSQKKIIL